MSEELVKNMMAQEMRVVTLESRMDVRHGQNLIERRTERPTAEQFFLKRSKMSTLASTAMPTTG